MSRSHSHTRKSGFTLVELLVVIAIIALLAGLLFPAFSRAREGGYQASCTSNLKQIYTAVQLYRQDEKAYPSSLAFLLPNDFTLEGGDNANGTGSFKGGRDALVCSDDDNDTALMRSSYGDTSVNLSSGPTDDMGRYLWNYWGYRAADTACTAGDVRGCAGTAYGTPDEAATAATDTTLLFDPASGYNLRTNPLKYSLSNRFAPTSTIVTHCVYHRLPTAAKGLDGPFETTDAVSFAGARDIVLRLDGTAKSMDISKFHTNGSWAKPTF